MKTQKSKVNKIQSVSIRLIWTFARSNNLKTFYQFIMQFIFQDIDKTYTDINRHKVQIEAGQKMKKKLVKGIEESKIEKDRLDGQKETLLSTFKKIEEKAFIVQENYKKTQEVIYIFLILWSRCFILVTAVFESALFFFFLIFTAN